MQYCLQFSAGMKWEFTGVAMLLLIQKASHCSELLVTVCDVVAWFHSFIISSEQNVKSIVYCFLQVKGVCMAFVYY